MRPTTDRSSSGGQIGGKVFWVVARLKGSGPIDLSPFANARGDEATDWEVVLSTEEPPFALDPAPPQIDMQAAGPVVHFSRPGAVIFQKASRSSPDLSQLTLMKSPQEYAGSRPRYVPASTYRLQVHRGFPLTDATAIVPYCRSWASAPVTRRRTSPRRRAARTATTSQPQRDQPRGRRRRGTRRVHRRAARARHAAHRRLRAEPHGHRHRRQPVVERRARERAELAGGRFFDIDWSPVKAELHAKLLLPILGDQYGRVLERGELPLAFDDGLLVLRYFDRSCRSMPGSRRGSTPARSSGARRRPRRRQPAPERVPEHHHLAAEPAAVHGDRSGADRRAAPREGSRADAAVAAVSPRRRRFGEAIEDARPHIQRHAGRCLRASTPCTSCSRRRPTGWRTGGRRRTRSTTAASSTSTRWPACASRTGSVRRDAQLLATLIRDGKVHGVRIDHPDGLFDPARYFEMLQELAARRLGHRSDRSGGRADRERPLYVVAEKILSGSRAAAAGVGGPRHDRLQLPQRAERPVRRSGAGAADAPRLREADRPTRAVRRRALCEQAADHGTAMASELNVLAHMLNRIGESNRRSRDFTLDSLRDVITEVVACFPVVSHVRRRARLDGRRTARSSTRAIARARRRNPAMESSLFDFFREVVLPRDPDDEPAAPAPRTPRRLPAGRRGGGARAAAASR